MADPISVKLHARWTPDLTANPQQPQCVSSGTVAGGVEFHLVVNYGSVQNEGAVINVSCHYIDILEQTNVHEPQHFRVDNPGGTAYTPEQISSICSDPPRGYQNYIVFSTPPFWGFACHNTSYVVKAAYSYTKVGPGGPPPQYRRVGPIELSITVNFQNLVVNAQPKFLKWDRSYPDNNDTTISFSLSSAQKKNCDVTIEIYPVDGTFPIYTTRLVVPCPGSATFQWDGTMNQSGVPPGTLAPTGIYTFDIIAVGACPYDQDRMRSANLSLSNVAVESQGLSAIRKGKFKFSYSLSDLSNIPPLSTTYSVFSPWLLVLKSGSSSNLLGDNSQEISDVNLETAGYHTFVVSSVCNNLNNKSHSPHPALEKGSKFRVAPAVCISNGWPFSGNAFCAYKHLGKVMHPDGLSSCNSEVRPDPQTNERRGGVIINAEPWQAFRSLHENAVFEFSGHGNEDSLYLGEDQSGKEKWFSVNWIENDTLTPPGSLSHLVFALFNGCDAGQTFPQAVVNKGAEASLGFNREISVVVCSTWERAFWKYATKYYTLGAQIFPPASVAQAAKLAFRDVWWKPWNWNPIAPFFIKRMQDSMVVVGDTYLYPARKGKILR